MKSAAESAMREVVGETQIAARARRGPRQDRGGYPEAAATHPRFLWRRDRDHPGPARQGRSAGPGHRSVPRRAARARRPRAAAQRGGILPQRYPAEGARRRGADQPGCRCLPRRDHRPRARATPTASSRSTRPIKVAQDVTAAAALPRDDGRDPQEHQQGHHRQGAAGPGRRPALSAAAEPARRSPPPASTPPPPASSSAGGAAQHGVAADEPPHPDRGRGVADRRRHPDATARCSSSIRPSRRWCCNWASRAGRSANPGCGSSGRSSRTWSIYDKRVLDFEPPHEEVIVSDQKRLVVDTYTRYRIVDPLLFYQTVGTEAGVRAPARRRSSAAACGGCSAT